MIIKYSSILASQHTHDCTWHIISDIKELQYGYYRKDPNKTMTKEEAEQPLSIEGLDMFITYFKAPMNEGAPANVISLYGKSEAYLMNDTGKTIEKIR